jgi:hypothetical protein
MLLLYIVSFLRLDFVKKFGHSYSDNMTTWKDSEIIFVHTIMLDLSSSQYMCAEVVSVVVEICLLELQGQKAS